MKLAPEDPNQEAYYLAHHPVYKGSDNIRVVFNASMKPASVLLEMISLWLVLRFNKNFYQLC